jgi:ABC-type glycerol-3-phosphate transport system permease component
VDPWPATLTHYHEVLLGSSRTARIGRAFVNSLVVATGSVLVVLATSAMAAYPLARMRFPGRDTVFVVLVGSLMIPNAVLLVPQYVLTQRLGWLSTYQGLIVPEAAMLFAFGVFLLRQFFLTMPRELEDAALIDGAGPWQVFSRIILPLSQPVLAALAIFAFRSAWNDFLWPLIAVNKPEMFPLPVALAPAERLQLRVLRADHGRRRAERAAAPGRLHRREPAHRRGRPPERPQGVSRYRRPVRLARRAGRLTARPAPGSAAAARAAPRSEPPPAPPPAA